jgi:hypothetical protein
MMSSVKPEEMKVLFEVWNKMEERRKKDIIKVVWDVRRENLREE